MQSSWSPVALGGDVPAGMVIPVRLPWAELAVWRGESGALAAWQDRCPHRGMRLSHGFVRGDMLSCLYHGWRYDSSGQCRKIPAHPDLVPPAAFCTTRFPCCDSDGLVWVAAEETVEPPPALPGGLPLCSLSFDASVESVADAWQLAGVCGTVSLPDTASPVTVALQRTPSGCTVHALLDESALAERPATLDALENQRRSIEADSRARVPA